MADEHDAAEAGAPGEDELLEALRQLKVQDVLVQTLSSVASLGFARLQPDARDLEQARLAIEALRALVPVLEGAVDDELVRDLHGARSSLQLAYARAVAGEGADDRADDAATT